MRDPLSMSLNVVWIYVSYALKKCSIEALELSLMNSFVSNSALGTCIANCKRKSCKICFIQRMQTRSKSGINFEDCRCTCHIFGDFDL